MAQGVSGRHLTAGARVRAQVSTCGIYGGLRATRTGFATSSWVLSSQYHCTVAPEASLGG